jgi:hypothetical protein
VPLTVGVARRFGGARTIASGALDRPVRQPEMIQLLSQYRVEASADAGERERCVAGLWKSEGLMAAIGKLLLQENSLRDPGLSARVLPVAHVGFGTGSAEALAFDVASLDALFGERCESNHLGFSYEGIGALLRIYESGFFKVMSGAFGLVPFAAQDGPDPGGFYARYLKAFPPELQRLITHGYGRLIAFTNTSVYRAIEEAMTLPPERVEPAVHGIAFAFAMMNSSELPRILRQSAVPFDPAVRTAFQSGLIYGLVFAEWYVPGMLAAWQPEGALEAALTDHARQEAALSAERGFPLAFRLARPRG